MARLSTLVLLLGALALAVEAITLQDMIANTNFVQPFGCNGNANAIQVTVFNGFTVDTDFVVQLNYGGSISTTAVFTVQPNANSLSLNVFAPNGGIIDRSGIMTLLATNSIFNGGSQGVVQNLPVQCGTVIADTKCSYVNIPCMVRNGQAIGNFFCMLWIYLILCFIGAAVVALVFVTRKKKVAEGIVLGRAKTVSKRPSKRERKRQVQTEEEEDLEALELVGQAPSVPSRSAPYYGNQPPPPPPRRAPDPRFVADTGPSPYGYNPAETPTNIYSDFTPSGYARGVTAEQIERFEAAKAAEAAGRR